MYEPWLNMMSISLKSEVPCILVVSMVVSILNMFEPYLFQKETTSEVSKAWGHMESTWSHGLQSVIVCFQILRFFIINQLWIVYDCIMLSRTITIITKHLLTILKPTWSIHIIISHDQPLWTNGHLGCQSLAHGWIYCNQGQVLEPPNPPSPARWSAVCPGKMGISWRPWCKLQN